MAAYQRRTSPPCFCSFACSRSRDLIVPGWCAPFPEEPVVWWDHFSLFISSDQYTHVILVKELFLVLTHWQGISVESTDATSMIAPDLISATLGSTWAVLNCIICAARFSTYISDGHVTLYPAVTEPIAMALHNDPPSMC